MSDNTEYYSELSKSFPFFVVWHDTGDSLPAQGNDHARTFDEAEVIAQTRVLHGSFDSTATIYKGNFAGSSKALRRYKWQERKIVYEELKRP